MAGGDAELSEPVLEMESVPIQSIPESPEMQTLLDHFTKKFGAEPAFVVRVPGRVNLIGEHVDYSGYAVCPMALQQHVLVAVRTTPESQLTLTNVDPAYADYAVPLLDLTIQVTGAPSWHQYFLCGVRGVIEALPENASRDGLQAAVLGTVPTSAGLSSSSALVSAAVLVASHAFGLRKTKKELAELAASSERYIGTQGGGMDQAIAFLATPGSAKLISFNPLNCNPIVLPEGAVFVVANSLAKMNKAATTDFNLRVVECRLVSFILAKRMQLQWRRYPTLSQLQSAVGLGVRHFRALACETLHEDPYTKRELCYELQIKQDELEKTCLTENTRELDAFKLKQRLTHVALEVERVQNFVRLCEACVKGTESRDAALWKLGNLMKQSHQSLRDLYECSHEDLETIVKLAEKHTLGARLTGAGWGGSTVALTTAEKADAYIKVLKEEFYSKKQLGEDINLDNVVFVTKPGGGAVIYRPEALTDDDE